MSFNLIEAIEADVTELFQLAKQELSHITIDSFKELWIRHDYGMLFAVRLTNVSNHQVLQVFQHSIQFIVLDHPRDCTTSQIAVLFLYFIYYYQPIDPVVYPVYYTSDFMETIESLNDPLINQLLSTLRRDNALVWNQCNSSITLNPSSDADNWYRKSKIKRIEQAISNDPLLVDPSILELCKESDKSANDNASLSNLLTEYRQSLL